MATHTWTNTFDIMRDVVIGLQLYMDVYERDVLMFIFARTRMFNKEWEAIPLRHFMHGVKSADGTSVLAPIAMSEDRLILALRHLEGKGIISVRRDPRRASEYRVCEESEIDVQAVLAYMQEHQPKQFMSIVGRHFQQPQETEAQRLTRLALENAVRPSPEYRGTPTPNTGEGLPRIQGNINIPINNIPISKSVSLRDTAHARRISLKPVKK